MDIKEALQGATVKVLNNHGVQTPQNSNPQSDVKIERPEADDLMLSFFNVDKTDLNWETADKLREIKDFAVNNTENKDDFGILNVLRDIKFRLGAPKLGVNYLDMIYNYIRLRSQAKHLTNQAKAMEQE